MDPFSILINAQIKTAEGKEYYLWDKTYKLSEVIGSGEGIDSSEDLFNLPVVESVSVELAMGMVGTINIEISTTFELGLQLLKSDLFKIGNYVQCRIGYANKGIFTPWFGGTTKQPSIAINSEEGLTASIQADSAGFAALRSITKDRDLTTGVSIKDIIDEFAERYGMKIQYSTASEDGVQYSDELEQAFTQETIREYTVARKNLSSGVLSDWSFVKWMLRCINIDIMSFAIEKDSVLVLFDRRTLTSPRPSMTLVYRGPVDFKTRFPLTSFETEGVFVWMPQGAVSSSSSDVDPDTKETVSHENDATQDESEAVGGDALPAAGAVQSGGVQVAVRGVSDGERTEPVSSRHPAGMSNVSSHANQEARHRGNMVANIEMVGQPLAITGTIVRVEGLGVFDGNYYINSLTHSAGSGEFNTTMQLVKNAQTAISLPRSLQELLDKVNNQVPREEEESEGGGRTVEPSSLED